MPKFKVPDEIITSLNNGRLVLFIGHDLDAKEYGFPSLTNLSSELVQKTGAFCRLCEDKGYCENSAKCLVSFRQAATRYKQQEMSISSLIDFLNNKLHIQQDPTLVYQLISQLPIQIIVTTAYDERLQETLRVADKAFHQITTDLQIIARQTADVQIIHLFGLLAQDDSLVLTEADHAALHSDKQLISIWLQGLLMTHTCLFVEIDFSAPYLQHLYNPIIQKLDIRRVPYVITNDSSHFHSIDVKFHPLDISPLEFFQALKRKVNYKPARLPDPPTPIAPYKFLDSFDANDRAIFVGRDSEIHELKNRIISRDFTILFAYSGMGKTSLLNAGVIPQLRFEGFQIKYIRLGSNPAASLVNSVAEATLENNEDSLSPESIQSNAGWIFIIDQAEELFTHHGEQTVHQEFVKILLTYINLDF